MKRTRGFARISKKAVKKCVENGPVSTNALNNSYAPKGIKSTDVIVRFLSLENFFRMVESKCNALARVALWHDVYEGFVLKLPYEDCKVQDMLKDFYGQCWTLRKTDSEILWNARCPNGYGVCIKSTIGKLAKSMVVKSVSGNALSGLGRLDAVHYDKSPVDCSQIIPAVKNIHSAFSSHLSLLDTFFVKRYEFNDENEVRVILDLPEGAHANVMDRTYQDDLLLYKFDRPEDFLDEVIFHPLMNKVLCDCIKCHLQKVGWTNVKIDRSHLYDLPSVAFELMK